MITTLLTQYAAFVPVTFIVALALVGTAGWLLQRRRMARTLTVLAGLSLVAVLALTLTRGDVQASPFCTFAFEDPFSDLGSLANIGMMVPLAFFGTLVTRRPVFVLAASSILSALIEITQALLPALGRACDTEDWFTNTIGASIGMLLALAVIILDRRATQHRNASAPNAQD
ncbi:VanZ family protein [Curtobacterium sp. MCBD17_026]|uniref:VanZ family protein n=1 Tax=Curtobacterium sp. MCBD17_026 TaxID=2175621 RepID=UPI0015E89083|nr:VanZ family protein [Curtobacterium sp. MCBD17_026]WIB72556.1 VanZ family protein [Curtobacterium sp. MCBD17_026]